MAGANNFQVFNEDYTNIMSDVDYTASTTRQEGVVSGPAVSTLHNKMYRQATVMIAALAAAMAAKEIDMLDSSLANLILSLQKLRTDDEESISISTAISALIPSGAKMVFYQTSAPSGWTLDTTHNDKALRVVSSSGGGSGGTHALSAPPALAHVHTGPSHTHTGPSHTHTTAGHALTEAELASHYHTTTIVARGNTNTVPGTLCRGDGTVFGTEYWDTNSKGSGTAHGHGDTGAAGTGATGASGTANTGSTTPTAFAPKYVDVIICTRN